MWVDVQQVIPNCVLLTDVIGKTGQPIIPKKTTLTGEHIKVLRAFLIKKVNVSETLANGQTFIPKKITQEQENDNIDIEVVISEKETFINHYLRVVSQYKLMFHQWQSGVPIDIVQVRKLFISLLERLDEIDSKAYLLHTYGTKDDYFYHHSVSLGLLAAYLARRIGYSFGEQRQIGLAGFLSDSGMAKINAHLIFKSRTLTKHEITQIRHHPIYSYRLVEDIATLSHSAKLAILQHHERTDRSGYPLGLSSKKIHPYAKIIAICDTYHAMTSERFYQEKQSPFQIIEELQEKKFTQLDPEIVNIFVTGLANFSIGTNVRLTNNIIGEIIFIPHEAPTRPIVRTIDGQFIVLKDHPNIFIEEIIEAR